MFQNQVTPTDYLPAMWVINAHRGWIHADRVWLEKCSEVPEPAQSQQSVMPTEAEERGQGSEREMDSGERV